MFKIIFAIISTLFCLNAHALTQGIQGHAAGDVVALRTDSEIMAWCDFNKQIVKTQFNVLCVYNGSKQTVSD